MSSEIIESIVTPESTPMPESEVVEPVVDSGEAPEAPDNSAMAARFAALARREKEVREAQERANEIESKYKQYQELEESAKSNPMQLLERYGIDLDSIIQASLGIEKPAMTPEEQIQALRDEIKAEKEKATADAEAAKKAEEEALQASIDEAILKHQHEITDHLSKNQEKYELIHLQGAQDLVWEVTEAWFDANNGAVLTPEEAADKVEDYLSEQVRKAMQLKRFTPEKPEPSEPMWKSALETMEKTATPTVSPTLTTDHMAPATPKKTKMSDEESKAAAAALLQWS
jgi:hypothetical protein